jgi:hypothetical protein
MIEGMDDASLPADLAVRPRDEEHGVPVPFACEDEDGQISLGAPQKRRVVRCALSRVCGLCGTSLGWPVVFLGSADEAEHNRFHFPPLHQGCAEAALTLYPRLGPGTLGIESDAWVLVTTGGFELERPADRYGDRRMAFLPNSVTDRRTGPAGDS